MLPNYQEEERIFAGERQPHQLVIEMMQPTEAPEAFFTHQNRKGNRNPTRNWVKAWTHRQRTKKMANKSRKINQQKGR